MEKKEEVVTVSNVKGLTAEVVQSAIKLADWNWSTFDRPGKERDFDLDESNVEAKKYPCLEEHGIENAMWHSKIYGDSHNASTVTVLLIRFNRMSETAIDVLSKDMDNTLYEFSHSLRTAVPKDYYIGDIDGDDIYVYPWDVEYESGWLTLSLKVSRE